jgi:SET domain-containing protein
MGESKNQGLAFFDLFVADSQIPGAGLGLFTRQFIPKGSPIVEYTGEIFTIEQCRKRYGDELPFAPYLYFVSYRKCIDSRDTTEALARYANDANGFVKVKGLSNNAEFVNKKRVPYIIATADITPESEIFVDYGEDYWGVKKDAMKKRRGKD